jgi:RNA polymerase sigma factor (TIGR02999 family)
MITAASAGNFLAFFSLPGRQSSFGAASCCLTSDSSPCWLSGSQYGGTGVETGPLEPAAERAEGATPEASRDLFAALYGDLRELAARQLRRSHGAPLSPTTLLHEAYIGMSGRDARFPDRGRFLGYAARVMRGLIIDFARERRALKRGAAFHITQLPTEFAEAVPDESELVQLSDALDVLATRDPRLAEVVDLKYFCGYSFADIAAQRGTSERTVQRDWEKARTMLYQQLQRSV